MICIYIHSIMHTSQRQELKNIASLYCNGALPTFHLFSQPLPECQIVQLSPPSPASHPEQGKIYNWCWWLQMSLQMTVWVLRLNIATHGPFRQHPRMANSHKYGLFPPSPNKSFSCGGSMFDYFVSEYRVSSCTDLYKLHSSVRVLYFVPRRIN